jgi:IPT/TIG domain
MIQQQLLPKIFLATTALSILFFTSCKKKNFNEDNTNPSGTALVQVVSLTPNATQYGNIVTIKGKNFGTISSIITLKINGTNVTYNLVNDSTITTTIPKGLGSGAVIVSKNNVPTNGPNFEYLYTGNVTTFSGNGDTSPFEGQALQVGYRGVFGLTLDAQNNLYVSDVDNNHIRKITPAGVVTVYPSSNDFAKTPADIFINNNIIYYTSASIHIIGAYNIGTNSYSKVAGNYPKPGYKDDDGTANSYNSFNSPFSLAKNSTNDIFVADYLNHCIRKISATNNTVSTFAGTNITGDVNGVGSSARFTNPAGIFIDANNEILVCDFSTSKVKKIATDKTVTTFAGTTKGYADGTIATAKFNQPTSITKDDLGNAIVTDVNNTIRCITASGLVYTLAGVDSYNAGSFANGIGSAARFKSVNKIIFAGNKTFYIADTYNYRIRKMIIE